MRFAASILVLLSTLLQSCVGSTNNSSSREFSSLNDTVLLETYRVKGSGIFSLGAGFLTLEDTNHLFSYPIRYPERISDVKGAHLPTDFISPEQDYMDILVGQIEGREVYVVDQNDNQDFTDDSIRILQPIDWKSSNHSVASVVRVYSGASIVQDTSWVRVGLVGDNVLYSRDEHLEAELLFNNHRLTLGLIDEPSVSVFTYDIAPQVGILSIDSAYKESMRQSEMYGLGEYLPLDSTYYRFDSLARDGSQIILVKEVDFDKQYGTQVGMLAPHFTGVSLEGDTLESSKLLKKPLVIANSCGCGGDVESTQAVEEIVSKYGSGIHTLHLDHRLENSNADWGIDVSDPYNEEINKVYRGQYCSRTAYLVGVNNRIVDKFNVMDWEIALSSLMRD